jgi:hypothetical protein
LVSELAIDTDLRGICINKHPRDFHDELAAALVDLASKALALGLAGNPRSVRIDQHIATQSRLVEESQGSLGRLIAPPVFPAPTP